MKYTKLILIALLMNSIAAFAEGGSAGNGGGAWVCENHDAKGTIRWATLVDIYQAKKDGLRLMDFGGKNYKDIIDTVMIKKLFRVNEILYTAIDEQLNKIKVDYVSDDLPIIGDFVELISPLQEECEDGTIKFFQLANYVENHVVKIQDKVFNSLKLSEVDKAALFIHEAVYAYLRMKYDDTDSVRARKIVGLLFSTIELEKLRYRLGDELRDVKGALPVSTADQQVGVIRNNSKSFLVVAKNVGNGRFENLEFSEINGGQIRRPLQLFSAFRDESRSNIKMQICHAFGYSNHESSGTLEAWGHTQRALLYAGGVIYTITNFDDIRGIASPLQYIQCEK